MGAGRSSRCWIYRLTRARWFSWIKKNVTTKRSLCWSSSSRKNRNGMSACLIASHPPICVGFTGASTSSYLALPSSYYSNRQESASEFWIRCHSSPLLHPGPSDKGRYCAYNGCDIIFTVRWMRYSWSIYSPKRWHSKRQEFEMNRSSVRIDQDGEMKLFVLL